MSDTPSKSAPYVPPATAASERMVGSVMSRLSGMPGTRIGRSVQIANRVMAGLLGEGASAGPDVEQQPLTDRSLVTSSRASMKRARPDRVWNDVMATPAQLRHETPGERATHSPMLISGGWEPPELVKAGLRTREAADSSSPLWGILPAVQLEQVVAALETALGSPAAPVESPHRREMSSRISNLPVLQGEGPRSNAKPSAQPPPTDQESPQDITQAARNASARLLDALRTHAAAHAASGDDRVTLSDMTLIAFAENKNQMAASLANSVPHPKEADASVGDNPNDKIRSNQYSILLQIGNIANKLMNDDSEDDQTADSRFGGS